MNQKGITLIELIVVFVIIAIAAGLIAPNVGGWLPRYRLRSATRDIVSTMRTAQMKAVSNRVQYQVNFNAAEIGATYSYALQRDSGGGKFVTEGAVQALPSSVTVNMGSLPSGKATFNTDSTCTGGSVTLSYEKGGVTQAKKTILLNPATGRVTF
jgi:prepilin-type N-terminal cleavage/methylation domain-containing protein